ncbi:NUT family member 2 [Dissostichus eleginoides]|uniref:NUT family member 2 n=1 Tax=Dissostichus eleginoides TaxID=100907 RepID=A0AAD9BTG0_DISEL|nr:NUT family member 2 [Dissostichus eleginoides]
MDSALFSPLENNLIDLLQVMSQVGLFHPSEPCVVPQNHPTVAEILQEIENPDTQTHMDSNQHRVQHLTSSFIPMQPQRAQDDPSYISIIPQPGFPPELIITPCSPPDVCWPNSTFGCGPRVLVPIISPPELCGPGMPRRSWLLLPEEEQQNIKLEDCSGSAHFLDEEILAGQSFEEYMAICDSFSTQEGNEEEENRGNLENSSFLEYLDELCSDEKRSGEAEFKPDTEFLDFFLSSDPELIDLLAQEKQEQEVTLKTENVAPAPKSDPDPIDLLSTSELVQEIRKVILEKLSYLRHDHSVEFTLDTKFLDSLLSSDPDPIDLLALEKQKVDNPNRNGENTRQRNVEPKGDLTTCSPLIPSHLLEEQLSTDYPVSATSALNHNGSLFMNFPSLQLPANVSPETSLASDLETRDNNALVEVHAAKWYESIEDVMFLLNLTDPESAQLFLESPLRGHPLASESTSTSSVSGSNEDPCTVGVKESTPSVRDDLLTFSPPAVSVLALKTQHQIKESQEQLSPKNIDLKSSCVEAVSVQAKSSFVIDSQAVDGKLSDSVPEDKTEPTVFVVSKDLASPELRTGNQEETERQDVAETLKETATKSREERKEENTKSKTKLKVMTKTRCSQRQSGQIEKEKPRPSGEVSKERAVERKPVEKSDKKTAKCTPEMQRLVYVTQKRRSFVGRELFKRLSHATEPEDTDKCSETGEKEQQKLNMEGGEQHWVDNLDMSTETGAENALLDHMPQVEKNFGKETKEKEIQMSSFVKRQTRSMTTEEKVLMTPLPATPVRRKVKSLETERNQMESSSKRDILDGDNLEVNAKEDETEPTDSLGFKSTEKKQKQK